MANPFEIYQEKIDQFNRSYGVQFSFEKYERQLKKINNASSLFSLSLGVHAEDIAYRLALLNLYRECVDQVIDKKSKGINQANLFNDFEKLMDSYREYCKQNQKKAPSKNGGWESGVDVVDSMLEKISDIQPNKAEYVKNSYFAGRLRLRDMRANLAKIEEAENLTPELLSQAFVYTGALSNVVENRSFWWKATHWIQNNAEQRDLKSFNHFLSKHVSNTELFETAKKLSLEQPINEIRIQLEKSKNGIRAKEQSQNKNNRKEKIAIKDIDPQNEIKKNNQKQKASPPKKLTPPKKIDQKKGAELFADEILKIDVQAEILEILDKSKMPAKTAVANNLVYPSAIGQAMDIWKKFSQATSAEAMEQIMQKSSVEMFKSVFKNLNLFQLNPQDKVVAAQKITNVILAQYSPATVEKSYTKYTDHYAVQKETAEIQQFLITGSAIPGAREEDYDNLMNDVQSELEANRTRINLNNLDEKVNSEPKAPMIQDRDKTVSMNIKK